jgi:hypothetical protein
MAVNPEVKKGGREQGGESIGERTLRLRDEQLDMRNENSIHRTVAEHLNNDKNFIQAMLSRYGYNK